MKRYLILILIVSALGLGLINGIIQKESIKKSEWSFVVNEVPSGYVNNEPKPIISRNHLIHMAEKEIPEELLKDLHFQYILQCETDSSWCVLFSRIPVNSHNNMILFDDTVVSVSFDKNGITQEVIPSFSRER